MTRTLVTSLGAGARGNSYLRVLHRFPCGAEHRSSLIGYSLLEYGGHDRLVVLGTSGSHWDELCHGHAAETDPTVEAIGLRIVGAREQGAIDAVLVAELQSVLNAVLPVEVVLDLIGEGVTGEEQQALLTTLVSAVAGSDSVTLDVTHGYRHLPMLLMMAALCLPVLRPGLTIEHIWYARLISDRDAPEPIATVLNLGGVLHFADWLAAMQDNALTGDYAAIAGLIGPAEKTTDVDPAAAMTAAGFFTTIQRDHDAKAQAAIALNWLRQHRLPGAGGLFQEQLQDRLDWFERNSLDQRQTRLARQALERGDYLRAAILGYEAYLSRRVRLDCGPNTDASATAVRDATKLRYEQNNTANRDWQDYLLLRDIRNALAHIGEPSSPAGRQALRSSAAMRAALDGLLRRLLSIGDGAR